MLTFTVWFRPSRRERWRIVARSPTRAGAVELIGTGGRRGGMWRVRAAVRRERPTPSLFDL